MPIHVVVIEDDAPTRQALCEAVEAAPSLRLAGQADHLDAASALLQDVDCQIVLLDLNLHGQTSFSLLAELAQREALQVLVISALGDEASVIAAVEAGAAGYLLKDGAFADVETPILQLLDGQAPISPGVARHLLRRIRPQARPDGDDTLHLTPREQQVLTLFAQGASYKEVANSFDISLHTVRDHVKALYRKLQAHSRGVAVRRALQQGIIRLPD